MSYHNLCSKIHQKPKKGGVVRQYQATSCTNENVNIFKTE